MTSASRAAVLGTTDRGVPYSATAVPFDFEDIRSSGTKLLQGSDDDAAGPIDLGFSFPFHGNSYSQVFFSSNGLITFDGASASYSLAVQTVRS